MRVGRRGLIGLALVLLTLGVYAPTLGYGFVSFDDSLYVTTNRRVQEGLSWEGLGWAFRANVASNWHPLTLASHMLDCELWGLAGPGHHLSSLLFHLANVGLVFSVLRRMTGATARSAVVAAFFAVHPTHVESVAWVAERKDVLSAFFFLLTLGAWQRYVARPGAGRYLLAATTFTCGLLAKPMVVTLPFVLLLLDVWPLRRLPLGPRPARALAADLRRLVLEKAPLFALAAAASVVTVWAQRGSLGTLVAVPLQRRIANALVSYVVYLEKTFWPHDLAAFYPLPVSVATWKAVLAAGLLVALTALALARLRRAPWLAVGWLWFLGMLVPVIGLVQVGSQAMADRYTYLPSIGLFLALAWEVPERLEWHRREPRLRVAAAAIGLLALLGLATVARAQVATWKDTLTLFQHAATVTENNYLALLSAGNQLAHFERREEAERSFRGALRARPSYLPTLRAYGVALDRWGRPAEALPLFQRAVKLRPRNPQMRVELAAVLAKLGRRQEAIAELRRALALAPGLERARARLRALESAPPVPAPAATLQPRPRP